MTTQYQQLVESIFGTGSMPTSSRAPQPNEITGALASSSFQTFNSNFVSRLHRLNGLWADPSPTRSSLITQVKNIAGAEWAGAYAELCAYDFFGQRDNWARRGLELDVSLPPGSTYSHMLGKTGPANVDIRFDFFDVYSDVKCLKDNLKELMDGVIQEATRRLGNLPKMYGFECRLDGLAHNFDTA